MSATTHPSQRDVNHRDFPHTQNTYDQSMDDALVDDRLCPGCKKSAVTEHGGLVVAFGQSFFHVDCFKCAKCGNQVNADTNLLLLSDGSPICANCSYSCNVCHLPILDEAIMTGDDSYHAHCFKCKVCDTRIDELVFAKTSHGIYCMNCHNKRMIKLREHAQRKAERAKEKAAATGTGSNRSRERLHQDNGFPSPGLQPPINSQSSSNRHSEIPAVSRSPAKPLPGAYVSDAFASAPLASPSHQVSSQSFSMTVAPPSESRRSETAPDHDRPFATKQNTLPIPNAPFQMDSDARRRSYDDGVRPLNILFGSKDEPIQNSSDMLAPGMTSRRDKRRSINPGISLSEPAPSVDAPAVSSPENLSPPQSSTATTSTTSRRDKRRSINPAVSLSEFGFPTSSSTLSPRSSPLNGPLSSDRMQVPPSPGGREPPRQASFPSQEQYDIHPKSPSTSSRPSPTSHHTDEVWRRQPRSASPSRNMDDQSQDQTIVVKSPPSSVTLGSVPPSKTRARTAGRGGQNSLSSVSPRDDIDRPSRSLGLNDFDALVAGHDDQIPGSRPHSGSLSPHSLIRSRSVSPAHRADVPSGIESETETDSEAEKDARLRENTPPAPPAKARKQSSARPKKSGAVSDAYPEADTALGSPDSDSFSESSPVERTSHSTFIAPALPPIRISMNTADFSELLSSVGGFPSLKSLDHLARISENKAGIVGGTPTPANIDDLTPTNEFAAIPPLFVENDRNDGQGQFIDKVVSQASQSPYVPPKPAKTPSVFTRPNESSTSVSSAAPLSSATSASAESLTLNGSSSSINESASATRITLTEPESTSFRTLGGDTGEVVILRLQEALADAKERGAQQLKMDRTFVAAILATLESTKTELEQLKSRFDGIKRTSKQYIDGITVAHGEYDRELKARREAEAEVTRLRVLLSGQVARLTAMSGEARKDELRQQISKELRANLTGLEQDLSNLKAERDMALAEVEELSATRSAAATSLEPPSVVVSRSLTKRFDNIKSQYRGELIPLTKEKESLTREIAELKAVRDIFLEETTVLNARNEELAQLSAVYSRRIESVPESAAANFNDSFKGSVERYRPSQQQQQQNVPLPPSLSSSTSTSSTVFEDNTADVRYIRIQKPEMEHHTPTKKFMKWPGSRSKEVLASSTPTEKKAALEHNFQQLSVLRFTRCDHCGDKMWGSQLRCTACPTSIHVRCITHVQIPCVQQTSMRAESPPGPLPPSMFGRDLVEQAHADSTDEDSRQRHVPVIVEKCIDAVEVLAMDYEGIYRKSGGSGQSKMITQLFERGDYNSFDLRDSDRFNDICSVTSVLKNYFRSLPVPLFTFDLHDDFMAAIHGKDPAVKYSSLVDLINKLPTEHYYTLRMLMLHLHGIRERCEKNLMTARNLGVVFGPTLMRSRDPSAEFSDMAGKALSVEWLVENAPLVFNSR